MKNIIFVAPPAAGKGTQSEKLTEKYGYVHVSTGALLRDVRNEDSERARIIIEYQDKGILVPEEIVLDLLKDRLNQEDVKKGFILDGYPRNIDQAKMLTKILDEINMNDYVVIYIDIDIETARFRTLGRRNCSKCGSSYNIYMDNMKPKVEGKCDECGSELVTRSDDNEETFNTRFNTMAEMCQPILDYYEEIGKLAKVKADEDPNVVFSKIEDVLRSDING